MEEKQLNELAYERSLELMEAPMSFAIPSRELAKKLAGTEEEKMQLAYGIDCFKMGYKQHTGELLHRLSEIIQDRSILKLDVDKEFAEEWLNNHDVPKWRRAFETISESGKPTEKDIWFIDESEHFLIKIPAGSTTARCLMLSELELLPKEEEI